MRAQLLALVAVVGASACSGPSQRTPPSPPTVKQPSLAEERARLTIPPGGDTAGALQRLAVRADANEAQAGWERAHYLIDLFDDARFRGNADSQTMLATALGVEPEKLRGEGATDRALEGLVLEVDRVLRIDRLHANALAARTLLEFDARPPTRRSEVFQRMVELKTVARGGGPMAANALLRLYGYCWRAMNDAAAAPHAYRTRILSHCLYPLYDSDPAPYFADDPRNRPPPPDWKALADELRRLIDPSGWQSRVVEAARTQRAAVDAFLERRSDQLPRLPDPATLNLPAVASATPYDWTPMLAIGDGAEFAKKKNEDIATDLRVQVQGDGRRRVAVALAVHGRAQAFVHAAEAAAISGADTVELMVTAPQTLKVPPGDYWSGRLDTDRVTRLATIPLSLALLGTRGRAPDVGPRATGWDRSRAALELHLVVGARAWKLTSPTGDVATISSDTSTGDATAALRKVLADVRAAYPDEDGLVLVAGDDATAGALAAAAHAASMDGAGHRLFSRLALADKAPKAAKRTLARNIERRKGAHVAVDPEELADRVAVLRRCYQGLLERTPKLAGTFHVELAGDALKVVDGPRDRKLRGCLDPLAKAMSDGEVTTATVTFGSS